MAELISESQKCLDNIDESLLDSAYTSRFPFGSLLVWGGFPWTVDSSLPPFFGGRNSSPESKPLPFGGAFPHFPSAFCIRFPASVSMLTAVRSLLLLKLLPSIGVYAPPRERGAHGGPGSSDSWPRCTCQPSYGGCMSALSRDRARNGNLHQHLCSFIVLKMSRASRFRVRERLAMAGGGRDYGGLCA